MGADSGGQENVGNVDVVIAEGENMWERRGKSAQRQLTDSSIMNYHRGGNPMVS